MPRLKINRHRLREGWLLLALGCVSGLTRGIAPAFYVLLGFGVLLTTRVVLRTLRSPEHLNAFSFFNLSVMIGYILGPSIAALYWAANPGAPVRSYVGPFAIDGYRDYLSLGLMTAYLAGGMLVLVEGIIHPISRISGSVQLVLRREDVVFIAVVLLLVGGAFASGSLGYMGVISGQEGEITVLGGIAGSILPAIVPVLVYAVANRAERSTRRLCYLIVLGGATISLAIMGRRNLIFALFVALVFVSLARPAIRRFFRPLGPLANPKKAILVGAMLTMLMVGIGGFTALRVATWELGEESPLVDRIDRSAAILLEGSDTLGTQLSGVAMARPGTLPGYLGQLEAIPGHLMLGRCLAYNVLTAVPRLVLPNKGRVLNEFQCTDESVNARFGLPPIDSPTTVLTRGYVDFAVPGALMYVVLIAAVFQLAGQIVDRSSILSFRLLGLSMILNAVLFVEQDLSFYFVTIRNLVVLYVVAVIVRFVSGVVSLGLSLPQEQSP